MNRRWLLGVTVGIAVLLAGCTAAPALPDAQPTRSSPPVSSVPTPTATVTPEAEPVSDPGPCEAATPAYPIADDTEVEQLGGARLAVPFDRGSMPHATGEAVLDEHGVPVAYKVADNDVISMIGARFCVGEQWIYWVNYVRRDGDTLYSGDTLNLDAHTILSVGDQNGIVHNNALPEGFVIPPQR